LIIPQHFNTEQTIALNRFTEKGFLMQYSSTVLITGLEFNLFFSVLTLYLGLFLHSSVEVMLAAECRLFLCVSFETFSLG